MTNKHVKKCSTLSIRELLSTTTVVSSSILYNGCYPKKKQERKERGEEERDWDTKSTISK